MMNFLTFSVTIIAFCCVYNVERVLAGGSINSNSTSQFIDGAAKVADIVETGIKLKESLPRKKPKARLHRRSTSLDVDYMGVSKKFVEAWYLLAKRTEAVANILVASEKGDGKSFVQAAIDLTGFSNSGVRPLVVSSIPEFKTLNGPLNRNFKNLLEENARNIGDIISCRILDSDYAEHYMMVLNDSHVVEVGVNDNNKKDGGINIRRFEDTNHYSSDHCLYHENVVVGAAIACDEKREKKKANKSMIKYGEKLDAILNRVISTMEGASRLSYSLLTCNCQDLVLYWAYGYVNNRPCIAQFFQDEIIKNNVSLQELKRYSESPC